jgi:hypothetical protein
MTQIGIPFSISDYLSPSYMELNKAVAAELFSGVSAFRPVYIDMEDDVLKAITDRTGANSDPEKHLISAVEENLHLASTFGHTFRNFNTAIRLWAATDPDGYPPHLALLAAFSRVAQNMGADDGLGVSNYYMRLERLFGQEYDSKLRHQFSDVAQRYYGLLNRWLDRHDHKYGVPTAYSFDSRVHVGLPISQSLLRVTDRKKLGELFDTYELRPNETMSRTDMERLIDSWIADSSLNDFIKRLWSTDREGARSRITTVATLELAAWSGTREVSGSANTPNGTRTSRISLAAGIGGFLEERLSLRFLVPDIADMVGTELTPQDNDGDSIAASALKIVGGALASEDQSVGEYVELTNSFGLEFSSLLSTPLTLETPSGKSVAWRPRRLMVLRRDPAMPGRFVQSPRADLGVRSMVICATDLAGRVQDFLEQVARPGFLHHTSESLKGCPSGWEVFVGVIVQDLADPIHVDLSPLAPELHRTRISFDGGLRLSSGDRAIWHCSAPPEIMISAHNTADAAYDVEFQPRDLSNESTQSFVDKTSFQGSVSVSVPAVTEPGELTIRLYEPASASKSSESRSLSLVTGSQPSPSAPDSIMVAREFGPDALLQPREFTTAPTGPYLTGLALNGIEVEADSTDWAAASSNDLAEHEGFEQELDWFENPESHRTGDSSTQSLVNTEQLKDSCFVTGFHVIDLGTEHNTQGSGRGSLQKNVLGECRSCGLKKIHRQWPDYSGRNRYGSGNRNLSGHSAPQLSPSKKKISDWAPIQLDHLLDALAYLGSGNWSTFQRLALQVDPNRYFPQELAASLESTAHIDFTFDHEMRPANWSAAPAVCLVNPDGVSGLLVGRRTQSMLEILRSAESRGDINVEVSDHGIGLPSTIHVNWESSQDPPEILRTGWVLENATNLAMNILSRLPGLVDAAKELAVQEISYGAAARHYSVDGNKWVDGVYDPLVTGAYQFGGHYSRYGYNDGSKLIMCDHKTTKHLAAVYEGKKIVSYDVDTRELTVPLGAELPGVLSRVACISSGRSPSKHPVNGWMKVYSEVEPQIAAGIFNVLYGTSK